jgi:hypothetical protein
MESTEVRGRSQWRHEGSKWSRGGSVGPVVAALMWIRIRIKIKSWIRIRIKVMRIRQPWVEQNTTVYSIYCRCVKYGRTNQR